jgi:hypothetical protein
MTTLLCIILICHLQVHWAIFLQYHCFYSYYCFPKPRIISRGNHKGQGEGSDISANPLLSTLPLERPCISEGYCKVITTNIHVKKMAR